MDISVTLQGSCMNYSDDKRKYFSSGKYCLVAVPDLVSREPLVMLLDDEKYEM